MLAEQAREVIAGDPLRRIEDLANVQGVMMNGRLYTVPELMVPFVSPGGLQNTLKAHRMPRNHEPGVSPPGGG